MSTFNKEKHFGLPGVEEPRELIRRAHWIRRAWERFVSSPETAASLGEVRPFIFERWRLSRQRGIDPKLERAPTVLSGEEVEEFLRNEQLGLAGRMVLDDFARVLEGSGCFALLADAKGRIYYQVGHRQYFQLLEALNCMPGALWAEDVLGPNGVGTPLAAGAPALTYGPEHFWESLHELACDGCPIVAPSTGRVLGTVTLAAPAEKFNPSFSNFTLSLARSVERMLALFELKRRLALQETFLEAQRRWPGDAIVLVDFGGRIVELNRSAFDILEANVNLARNCPIEAVMPSVLDIMRRCQESGVSTERICEERGRALRVRCNPVSVEGRPAGALLIITPLEAPATSELVRATTPGLGAAARGAPLGGASRMYGFGDILGSSRRLLEAVKLGEIAALSDKPVLLIGETGTGKELFAQAIHNASARAKGPFVAVNCAALPRELVESELFGYTAGAFTGAKRQGAPGRFELAHGGTLFLDEISLMPLETQPKLLRVLETSTIERLGGGTPMRVDVRVIAASNEDLATLCRVGSFRQDLYFRLNVLAIYLPALRERPEDILLLARTFISQECARLRRPELAIRPELAEWMTRYSWPGNVRELKNLCERWAALVQGESVGLEDLPPEMRLAGAQDKAGSLARTTSHEEDELALIRATLAETGNNISEAARRLGISRTTIYSKLFWKRGSGRPGKA